MQPYTSENGHDRLQQHLHDLPWPADVLRDLGSVPVTMRITLSYFIEPSPGQRGWKNKFRYASHGLRFELVGPMEDRDTFIRRVSKLDDNMDERGTSAGNFPERWSIGSTGRSSGSVHSDFIKTTAANLATCNLLAIFPVIGWWRERKHLNRAYSEARYSLIVSLHTDEQNVDLYTPVMNQIANRVQQPITIANS